MRELFENKEWWNKAKTFIMKIKIRAVLVIAITLVMLGIDVAVISQTSTLIGHIASTLVMVGITILVIVIFAIVDVS